jgi:hypothetical protein
MRRAEIPHLSVADYLIYQEQERKKDSELNLLRQLDDLENSMTSSQIVKKRRPKGEHHVRKK